jgi:membrane protease YdiL (CAAX protease family)
MTDLLKGLLTPAVVIGAFSPLISAVILVYKEGKWKAVRNYFKEKLNFRIKWVYYVLAIAIPFGVTIIAHYFTIWTGIDNLPNNLFPEGWDIPVIAVLIPYIIFIALFGGGQEEFGWRGYVQDPLQEKFGVVKGSLLLGIVWAVWHLPLWFIPGEGHQYYSFFAFGLFTICLSVIIGVLYNASGKKMVVPWIVHTISNTSVPLFPVLFLADVPQPGYWVWVIVNVITATILVIWYQQKNSNSLSKGNS